METCHPVETPKFSFEKNEFSFQKKRWRTVIKPAAGEKITHSSATTQPTPSPHRLDRGGRSLEEADHRPLLRWGRIIQERGYWCIQRGLTRFSPLVNSSLFRWNHFSMRFAIWHYLANGVQSGSTSISRSSGDQIYIYIYLYLYILYDILSLCVAAISHYLSLTTFHCFPATTTTTNSRPCEYIGMYA